MSNDKYDIFVSHAYEDKPYVKKLVEALHKQDMKVWYDEVELKIGDSLLRGIEDALEGSQFFALVISEDYLSEEAQWTYFETGVAITRDNELGGGHIIPIILGDVDLSKLPATVKGIKGLHANNKSVEEIASEIADAVNKSKERV